MNEIKFNAIVKKASFGTSVIITLDIADDNELEALHIAPFKGQSLEWSVKLPEVIRD